LLILVCGFKNVINSTKMTTLLMLEENPILFSLCRRLFQLGLGGTLVPDLGNLSHLMILDVMWNNLSGNIPPTLGNLTNLNLLYVTLGLFLAFVGFGLCKLQFIQEQFF
jgi:hypothetical protein